jgi:hypothetical protein
LKLWTAGESRRRRGVTAVLATIIVFTIVLTVAVGAFVFVNEGVLGTLQAQQENQQTFNQASQEELSMKVGLSAQTGDLWLRVSNTGTVSATVVDVFITNSTSGAIVSGGGNRYFSAKPNLNLSLPITILPGVSTNQMSGCGAAVGCDIAVSSSTYSYPHTGHVAVSVVTSSGNVFSSTYPPPPTGTVTTETSTIETASTDTVNKSNSGGTVLVVQMSATPPQTFDCTHCVNDTATVYNYGNATVTGISLSPSPPQANPTGKITVTPYPNSADACVLQGTNDSLGPYEETGPPSLTFLCTYGVNINNFGGFLSFIGSATGTYKGLNVTSGVAVSNTIQVGGPSNPLNQGPFSANYFFFKVSYCYQTNPVSFFNATAGCRGLTPSTLSVSNLPNANLQNASTDYYDAYYVEVTNNFNVTIPLLQYSLFQTDPTRGGESDFYLVGVNNGAFQSNGAYFPSYNTHSSGNPTLTGYPTDCATVGFNNVPTDPNCIYINPGQTVVLTFAACAPGSTSWDWGGIAYGRTFDNSDSSVCFPQAPPNYFTPESTYLDIVLSFAYGGQVLDQNIPFEGETLTGGTSNGGLSCNENTYCGQVYFTEYGTAICESNGQPPSGNTAGCQPRSACKSGCSYGEDCQVGCGLPGYGAVGDFNFTYNSATQSLKISPTIFVVPPSSGLPHGVDGIQFNPQDHQIMVGANDGTDWVQEVDPTTAAISSYHTTVEPYNLMVQSDSTKVWMDGDGVPGLASMTLTPLPGNPATLTLTGDDSQVNTIVFIPGVSTYAFYTSECNTNNAACPVGTRFDGVQGHVGIINLLTGATSCFKSNSGSCILFQGVHGAVYDPYSGDLIVFGSNMVNQITTSGVCVSHETIGTSGDNSATDCLSNTDVTTLSGTNTNLGSNSFDQGAVDGFGHLFLSWNGGGVYFEDFSANGIIGSNGNYHYFTTDGGALHDMDDVAPIIGPGSAA